MCEDKATVRAKSFKIVRTKMQGHRVQRALHACELSIDEVDKLFCLFPSFSKLTATLHIVLNDNCMYQAKKKITEQRTFPAVLIFQIHSSLCCVCFQNLMPLCILLFLKHSGMQHVNRAILKHELVDSLKKKKMPNVQLQCRYEGCNSRDQWRWGQVGPQCTERGCHSVVKLLMILVYYSLVLHRIYASL